MLSKEENQVKSRNLTQRFMKLVVLDLFPQSNVAQAVASLGYAYQY